MKKSHVIRARVVYDTVRSMLEPFAEDRVTVYAAQASFFVVISSVPFLSVLFAVIGLVAPADLTVLLRSAEDLVPAALLGAVAEILTELRDVPVVSLLSISALTTLWSASRGISAIRNGLQTVYAVPRKAGFLRNRLYSLVYTVAFIVIILAAAVLLLFGDFLYDTIAEKLPIPSSVDALFRFRAPIVLAFITLVFNAMYYTVARRSPTFRRPFFRHLPGAVLASVGWGGFSWLYSLYIAHFPKAASLYGGLTAVCLIMLWLYFCMIILLGGGEINKLIFQYNSLKKQQDIV